MSTKNSKIHQEKVEKNRAFAQEQATKKNSEKRVARRLKGLQGISENLQDQIKTLRGQIHGTVDRKTLKDRMDGLVEEFDEWKKALDERLMAIEVRLDEIETTQSTLLTAKENTENELEQVHQAMIGYHERLVALDGTQKEEPIKNT